MWSMFETSRMHLYRLTTWCHESIAQHCSEVVMSVRLIVVNIVWVCFQYVASAKGWIFCFVVVIVINNNNFISSFSFLLFRFSSLDCFLFIWLFSSHLFFPLISILLLNCTFCLLILRINPSGKHLAGVLCKKCYPFLGMFSVLRICPQICSMKKIYLSKNLWT